jgi:outer membrane lipoprotein-sorting protein
MFSSRQLGSSFAVITMVMLLLPSPTWAQQKLRVETSIAGEEMRRCLYNMEKAYEKVEDYTTIFLKQERVNGKLLPKETVFMKFRKPFSVYMKWIGEPRRNQEVLFVSGWNNNKLLAHKGSFPDLTVALDPRGSLAMTDNRHPITDVDIGTTINLIVKDVRRAEQHPEDGCRMVDHGVAQVFGANSRCVEAVMPARKDSGYYAHRAMVCVNLPTGLPNKVTIWDYNNELVEDYGYQNVKTNVGLAAKDFDRNNPDYDF